MVMAMDAVIAEALAARKPELEQTIREAKELLDAIDGLSAGRLRIRLDPAEKVVAAKPKPKPDRSPARKQAQAKHGAVRDAILNAVAAEPGIAADTLNERVCAIVPLGAKNKAKSVRTAILNLVRGGRITMNEHRHVFPVRNPEL